MAVSSPRPDCSTRHCATCLCPISLQSLRHLASKICSLRRRNKEWHCGRLLALSGPHWSRLTNAEALIGRRENSPSPLCKSLLASLHNCIYGSLVPPSLQPLPVHLSIICLLHSLRAPLWSSHKPLRPDLPGAQECLAPAVPPRAICRSLPLGSRCSLEHAAIRAMHGPDSLSSHAFLCARRTLGSVLSKSVRHVRVRSPETPRPSISSYANNIR